MTPFPYRRYAETENGPVPLTKEVETGWIFGSIHGKWVKLWVYPVMFLAPFILFGGWFYHWHSNLQRQIEELKQPARQTPALVIRHESSPSSEKEELVYYESILYLPE